MRHSGPVDDFVVRHVVPEEIYARPLAPAPVNEYHGFGRPEYSNRPPSYTNARAARQSAVKEEFERKSREVESVVETSLRYKKKEILHLLRDLHNLKDPDYNLSNNHLKIPNRYDARGIKANIVFGKCYTPLPPAPDSKLPRAIYKRSGRTGGKPPSKPEPKTMEQMQREWNESVTKLEDRPYILPLLVDINMHYHDVLPNLDRVDYRRNFHADLAHRHTELITEYAINLKKKHFFFI